MGEIKYILVGAAHCLYGPTKCSWDISGWIFDYCLLCSQEGHQQSAAAVCSPKLLWGPHSWSLVYA